MLEASQYLTSNYTYYRAITVKTAWYWHKDRQEDPDRNRCTYIQLIFNKGAQDI
jgi:hypothetical protein